jgi:uncharacterized protein YdeI (YjbR/CyaY-like superfamily)
MNEPTLYAPSREAWREWLETNHASESHIWLIYYKKHTGKPSVPYNDAVEEALCFGWIDSLVQRIDEEKYMQKYTPRKPKSTWSKLNVRRVEKMMKEGKMTPVGMELYNYAVENGLLPDMDEQPAKKEGIFPEVPEYFSQALSQNPKACETFNRLAPSYKLAYLGWIMQAKREETRQRRLKETIELLSAGKKLGMK